MTPIDQQHTCVVTICKKLSIAIAMAEVVALPHTAQGSTPSRTRKILCISNRHENPGLLRLPRELRDLIYHQVLVEPELYDKRHHPQCSYDQWAIWPRYYDRECPEQCKALCSRRRGMSLLRVSKQISEEATEFFYEHNTFDFIDGDDLVSTLLAEPRERLHRIKRLSLQDRGHADVSSKLRRRVFAALDQIDNLQYLELSRIYLGPRLIEAMSLLALKTLRISVTKCFYVENINRVGIHRDFELLDCDRARSHPERERAPRCAALTQEWCEPCLATLDKMRGQINHDLAISGSSHLLQQAMRRIRDRKLEHSGNTRFVADVRLDNGWHEQVSVWGLPTESYETAVLRMKAEAVQKRRQALRSITPRRQVVVVYDVEEDDGPAIGVKKERRRRQSGKQTPAVDKDMILQARLTKKEVAAALESAERKTEAEESARTRSEIEAELKAQRLASRRRVQVGDTAE